MVDVRGTIAILLCAHPALGGAAIAVAYADRAVMIGKWYPLLGVQVPLFPLAPAVRAYLAAGFAAIFLPASAGADVVRAVSLGRRGSVVAEVGACVVLEQLLGMLASGVMSLVALALAVGPGVRLDLLLPWAVVAILTTLLICAAPFSPGIRAYLARPPSSRGSSGPLGWSCDLYHYLSKSE